MRFLFKLAVLAGLVYAAKWIYENYIAGAQEPVGQEPVGYDTPTGTDPNAKYSEPGYQDKSFGQAVSDDQALVDQLVQQTDGNLDEAAIRFRDQSAGAPALERQQSEY
jgi:hypothetical protein